MSDVKGFAELRKALKGFEADYLQAQKNIVRGMAGEALKQAVENTPVGDYDKMHEFTARDGETIFINLKTKQQGGTLRRNWKLGRMQVKNGKISQELNNNTEYALYVNNGHRIVNKKGETVGWREGVFMLEDGMNAAEEALPQLYEHELQKAARKHGL